MKNRLKIFYIGTIVLILTGCTENPLSYVNTKVGKAFYNGKNILCKNSTISENYYKINIEIYEYNGDEHVEYSPRDKNIPYIRFNNSYCKLDDEKDLILKVKNEKGINNEI